MSSKSFFAIVKVKTGTGTLIGGVTAVHSSRFEKREHAVAWLQQTQAANLAAGRELGESAIHESIKGPEIPASQIDG